jgi:hypothetical protein
MLEKQWYACHIPKKYNYRFGRVYFEGCKSRKFIAHPFRMAISVFLYFGEREGVVNGSLNILFR